MLVANSCMDVRLQVQNFTLQSAGPVEYQFHFHLKMVLQCSFSQALPRSYPGNSTGIALVGHRSRA